MAYNYEYPYTDPERGNADWLIMKMKELEEKIVGIEDTILASAKEYVDLQMLPYQNQISGLRSEFEAFKRNITSEQVEFEQEVRNTVIALESRIDLFRTQLHNEIMAVNVRTDIAILQNNEFLMEELSKGLISVKVTNFFTGLRVGIQEMFDYLAGLHVTDGITYAELVNRNNTYSDLVSLGITYTDLVLHGNTKITQK